jgi:glycosyltransferase involved in cell wall biosynthesis
MNVLFSTYPMAFHTPGGGEVQLMQYKEFLPGESVDVTLLDLWDPGFLKFDLVHFFSSMSGSVHFCAFVKSINLPLFVSPNLWITEENKGNYPYDEIRTQFVLADRVICNSDMECDLLARVFNIPRERFSTVYNGVNEAFFEPSDPTLFRQAFDIDGPFVLNVANLEPRKNQVNLVRAIKAFPQLQLVLIGYERDQAYAKACLIEGGDQVRYIGSLPHDSTLLKSAYAACEVFALPSTLETPGLAALEASACGAKIVITGEGCAREYFGEGAEYVRPDDVADIARGIARSLTQPHSLLSTVVTRANFTWRFAANTLGRLYSSVKDNAIEQVTTHGFHAVERDEQRLFSWSRSKFGFATEPGVLSFLWRSIDQAWVDIFLDGVALQKGLKVEAGWSRCALEIPRSTESPVRHLQFKVHVSGTHESAGEYYGVALSEVSLAPLQAPQEGIAPAASDVPFIKNLVNFHPTDTTPFRRQAWTRPEFSFATEPGVLSFLWRSIDEASVDIFLDGVALQKGLKVKAGWSRCALEIPHSLDSPVRHLEFKVYRVHPQESEGQDYGVALAELSLTPIQTFEDGMVPAASDVSFIKNLLNFHPTDTTPFRRHAWTRPEFGFATEPGVLNFLWRSIEKASVDVFLEGVVLQRGLEVEVGWSRCALEIPRSFESPVRHLQFKVHVLATHELAGEDYGVAVSEVSLTPLQTLQEGMAPAASDVTFIKNLVNFHPTDTTPHRRQAWTRRDLAFDCEPGVLNFWWHSLAGAEVDIFVDEVAVQLRVHVSPDWALHTLNISETSNSYRRVRLAVNAEQFRVEGDPRELAVALGAFSLEKQKPGLQQ